MADQPLPAPPLDGVPPSPPGLAAGGGSNPSMSQLTPSMALGGSMQIVQMSIQAIAQAAKLLDLVGQINPNFAPAAQMLIEQMRGALKSSLQQGTASSEPSAQMSLPNMAMPTASAVPGSAQQPLPPMGAGIQ